MILTYDCVEQLHFCDPDKHTELQATEERSVTFTLPSNILRVLRSKHVFVPIYLFDAFHCVAG